MKSHIINKKYIIFQLVSNHACPQGPGDTCIFLTSLFDKKKRQHGCTYQVWISLFEWKLEKYAE